MENFRGNLGNFEKIAEEIIQKEVSLGGNPTIIAALLCVTLGFE